MAKSPPSPATHQSPLPLLPTRELIVFPRMVAPIFVGREKSVKAIERAFAEGSSIVLCSQREPTIEEPTKDDILPVGTRATIVQLFKLPDGSVKALVEGQERVRIDAFTATSPHFVVEVSPLVPADCNARRSKALARRVLTEFGFYVAAHPQIPDEAQYVVAGATDPEQVADLAAGHLLVSYEEKQRLLEMASTEERLRALLESLVEENAVLQLEQELAEKVQRRIETMQRQVFLHEKMRTIRDELTEVGEEADDEAGQYTRQVAERGLPETAAAVVAKEIAKLRNAPPMSPEIAVVRTFLDTVLGLPWGRTAATRLDIAAVARHLARTHYGLKDVKDRILEYLAVSSLLGADQPNTIICLVGPPGTGKSSIARAIADALGRPFVRVSLGGVRDEAEIRGHRRTYVGAMPGRIIDGIAKAGVDNPVMLLDELDKMESDWRGNPAAALMEVLDPAQNSAFRDTYLEVDYDLSQVFFIATANDAYGIPHTLFDRLEVIETSGYTLEEKVAIARRHLLPRTAAESGLARQHVLIAAPVLRRVIREYTREAGVRELERLLRRVYRKVARRHLEEELALPVEVTVDDLATYLGEPHFRESELRTRRMVGESLGLAYTADGGDVLTIEASIAKGRGDLILTGQLGDVMQESASAAWGYLLAHLESDGALRQLTRRSRYAGKKGIDLQNRDVRVHVPEGAVPKDGPSAGLAIAAALLSAVTGVPLRPRVAMTGEITLSGRILRVGGLKEKCLAAVRNGVRTVVLPEESRPGLRELPPELLRHLSFVCVRHFTEALPHILAGTASRHAAAAPVEDSGP
ncbi:MAG TPA: endopeptidase La [Thermoleophilia bacterium]|nr:endopeptidase La [Thermoleophilia bacterium]